MELTRNKRIAPKAGRVGFTLLEILATFVLVALILPVAMKGLGLTVRLADRSTQKVEASFLAERQLTELVVTEAYLNGSLSGDFGEVWPEYRWEAEVRDWSDTTLKEINFHVFWEDALREQVLTLTTLVYIEE